MPLPIKPKNDGEIEGWMMMKLEKHTCKKGLVNIKTILFHNVILEVNLKNLIRLGLMIIIIEYKSIKEVFCLCYLFKSNIPNQDRSDYFVNLDSMLGIEKHD
ncbi:LOW QUALITY PROTEIN: hypothetical protein OSB04_002775 [Centaurea solstitialis]|uniref:Uncharacterized protein n=1 Tax=Centaurea solstitialis TaxID=347529 RepID=A0AA38WUZ8_9ASTR|nr:LOW QUALITY PROTEIN: hypothetical protein OSB04_002775 [Centaurea solstitialis]